MPFSAATCARIRCCIFLPQSMREFGAAPSMTRPLANLWCSIQRVTYGLALNRAGASVALMVVLSGSGIAPSVIRPVTGIVHVGVVDGSGPDLDERTRHERPPPDFFRAVLLKKIRKTVTHDGY